MALLQDLIQQIEDPALRDRIAAETNKLLKQKKFGLVFEEHLPECTPLYEVPVRVGGLVAKKAGYVSDIYLVTKIEDTSATCLNRETREESVIPLDELVSIAQFGEPIYPYLKPIDTVCNAPDSDLWHTLIEADNYHALQLLEYLYAGKVDCIYIDPPYNTGAKDWKYNNDYVDGSDTYRHSKWLSMMEKRLKLAKKLLNPTDSVLIVTIDEKEYLHLGCLLEELFPESRIQMISTMINPAIVAREGEFGRSGEYIFYVYFGEASPQRVKINREWVSDRGRTHTGNIRWDLLKRSGTGATRKDSPGGFYPIYINPENGKIEKVGDPLPDGISEAPQIEGLYCLLPIRNDGTEGRWQWSTTTLLDGLKDGRVKVGGDKRRGFTVYRLARAEYAKVVNGEFEISGRGINNEIIVDDIDTEYVLATPGDIWKIASHDSTQYGSRLLGNIFGEKRFTFPKSVYAVTDCLFFVLAYKPNALIVDFFAGSGTTLHAVNLLNAINTASNRIEPEEIEWLRELSKDNQITQVPIIVVLTQSFSKKKAQEMRKILLDENLDIIQVVPVLAENYEIEDLGVAQAYGLDILIQVMEEALPDELMDTLHNVQIASLKAKKLRAQAAVATASVAAAGEGAAPIPFADCALLIPTQLGMIASITVIFGFDVNKSIITALLSSTIGAGGATLLGKTVVSNLLKLIPGAGTVAGGAISAGTAGVITAALGEAYIGVMELVFKGDMSLDDLGTEKGKQTMSTLFKQSLKAKKAP